MADNALENAINLLNTVFLPLVSNYLNHQISPKEFEKLYINAFKYYKGGGTDLPDDLSLSISTVFMDLDEFWPEFNPDDPNHVRHLEDYKNFTILEPELYKRCLASYDVMLAVLEKYDQK